MHRGEETTRTLIFRPLPAMHASVVTELTAFSFVHDATIQAMLMVLPWAFVGPSGTT